MKLYVHEFGFWLCCEYRLLENVGRGVVMYVCFNLATSMSLSAQDTPIVSLSKLAQFLKWKYKDDLS
jgi:hypothetical protein